MSSLDLQNEGVNENADDASSVADSGPDLGPDYCMRDQRCSLCRFSFEENEIVMICTDTRTTLPFSFKRSEVVKLDDGITVHLCGDYTCSDNRGKTYAFHTRCHSLAPGLYSNDFSIATEYSYIPTLNEEYVRAKNIRGIASRALRQTIPKHLPQEIYDMIANNLVLEWTTLRFQRIFVSSRSATASHREVTLAQNIYATYCDIEGVSYIQTLSNKISGSSGELIYRGRERKQFSPICIAFDYLGIRRVIFEKSPAILPAWYGPQPYWCEIRPDKGFLYFAYDGLKVRDIRTEEYRNDSASDDHVPEDSDEEPNAWPSPCLAYKVADSFGEEMKDGAFMNLTECRASTISGFSASVRGGGFSLAALLVDHHYDLGHSRQRSRIYNSLNITTWMHMPIDQGELVEDIWLVISGAARRGRKRKQLASGLMLVTNHGHATMFCPMLYREEWRNLRFLRIFSRFCPTSRLYLSNIERDYVSCSIYAIGVDKNLSFRDSKEQVSSIKDEWLPFPPSITPCGRFPLPNLEYFSKCRLEETSSITCCVYVEQDQKSIIGMMLYYRNGSRACVGMYHHDWTIDPLVIHDSSKPLSFTLCEDEAHGVDEPSERTYITAVSIDGNSRINPPGSRNIQMPWHGWLEWWFSPRSVVWTDSSVVDDSMYCYIEHVR